MEVCRYVTESGKDVLGEWLARLRDVRTKAKIIARIDRLAAGNLGDCKALGSGLFELRIHFGPGYRVYFAFVKGNCALLLCGGDKGKQSSDIKRALDYLKDYRERTQ
jgi:putative addiction module killer protein